MGRIGYIVRCALRLDYKNLFRTVREVHKISGKNRLWLLADIVKCGFRYGAGHMDYLLCAFYDKTREQRETFVTRGINNTVTGMLNDPAYYATFDDKEKFYTAFAPYLHRVWLPIQSATDEALTEFLDTHAAFILKPRGAACGVGVEKRKKEDFPTAQALRDYAQKVGADLIEELVIQHPEMDRMAPGSVNTVRVMTVLTGGQPHVLYVCLRIGNSDRPVDNINAGGMFVPVDIENGCLTCDAIDKNSQVYQAHPKTGCVIKGFQIPYWQEAKQMCLEAARVVPQMGYVGWDVAITGEGPLLIEGNNLPGHDLLPQMPVHTPDNMGYLPVYKKYIKNL